MPRDLKESLRERLRDLIDESFATYYEMDEVEVEELVDAITDEAYDAFSGHVDDSPEAPDEDSG